MKTENRYSKPKGAASGRWKGGFRIDPRGYIKYREAGIDRYVHRMVAEHRLGRKLRPGEQVHHRDGDKSNNAWRNLIVNASQKHHFVWHRSGLRALRHPDDPNPIAECLCACGRTFTRFDRKGRPRFFVRGHHNFTPYVSYAALVDELRTHFKL